MLRSLIIAGLSLCLAGVVAASPNYDGPQHDPEINPYPIADTRFHSNGFTLNDGRLTPIGYLQIAVMPTTGDPQTFQIEVLNPRGFKEWITMQNFRGYPYVGTYEFKLAEGERPTGCYKMPSYKTDSTHSLAFGMTFGGDKGVQEFYQSGMGDSRLSEDARAILEPMDFYSVPFMRHWGPTLKSDEARRHATALLWKADIITTKRKFCMEPLIR